MYCTVLSRYSMLEFTSQQNRHFEKVGFGFAWIATYLVIKKNMKHRVGLSLMSLEK